MTDNATPSSNYSQEDMEYMLSHYNPKSCQADRDYAVDTIATAIGRSPESVRAKLSYEGMYVPKLRATKNGDPIVKKDQLVSQIAELLGETEEAAESLERVTKPLLRKLAAKLREPT